MFWKSIDRSKKERESKNRIQVKRKDPNQLQIEHQHTIEAAKLDE